MPASLGFRPSASLHPGARPPRSRRRRVGAIGAAAATAVTGAVIVGNVAFAATPLPVAAPAPRPGDAHADLVVTGAVSGALAAEAHRQAVLSAQRAAAAKAAAHRVAVAAAHERASRSESRQPLSPRGGSSNSGGATFSGEASFYGADFAGRRTASGATFDPSALTAASKTLPFGTRLRVCHSGGCVEVTINDRGPYVDGRILDLSQAAARQIGLGGVGYVTATPLSA